MKKSKCSPDAAKSIISFVQKFELIVPRFRYWEVLGKDNLPVATVDCLLWTCSPPLTELTEFLKEDDLFYVRGNRHGFREMYEETYAILQSNERLLWSSYDWKKDFHWYEKFQTDGQFINWKEPAKEEFFTFATIENNPCLISFGLISKGKEHITKDLRGVVLSKHGYVNDDLQREFALLFNFLFTIGGRLVSVKNEEVVFNPEWKKYSLASLFGLEKIDHPTDFLVALIDKQLSIRRGETVVNPLDYIE